MNNQPSCFTAPRRRPDGIGVRAEGGFLTVEAVLMIMVLVVLIPVAYTGWNMGFAALKARSVAQQLQQVSEAAKVYARSQGLLTTLVPGAVATSVTGKQLKDAGVLPHSAEPDIVNAWKHSYKIYYSLPAEPVPPAVNMTRHLQVVVVTVPPASGGAVPEEDARKAAGFAGASGGIITQDVNTDLYLGNAVSGWRIKVGDPALPDTGPAMGSIGTYASLDDKALNSDVLYRVDVGRPELNQMHVDLDMSDKALKNVGNIQFNATSVQQTDLATVCKPAAETDGKVFYYTHPTDINQSGLYACKAGVPYMFADAGNSAYLRKAVVVKTGSFVNKPTCTGTSVPFISVSPANVVKSGAGSLVGASIYSSYTDASSTQWQVKLTVTSTLGVGIDVTDSTLSVITSCTTPTP